MTVEVGPEQRANSCRDRRLNSLKEDTEGREEQVGDVTGLEAWQSNSNRG